MTNHIFPMRGIVRNILKNRHCFAWTYHGLGMIRCYPFGDKVLRLNLWHKDFISVPPASELHTHPWNLFSKVIVGEVTNIRYLEAHGAMDGSEAFNFRTVGCGPNPTDMAGAAGITHLVRCSPEVYQPNATYRQHADEIHRTTFRDGSVTIMERQNIDGHDQSARVFWPYGTEWGDAAPRDATRDEINSGCAAALAEMGSAR